MYKMLTKKKNTQDNHDKQNEGVCKIWKIYITHLESRVDNLAGELRNIKTILNKNIEFKF